MINRRRLMNAMASSLGGVYLFPFMKALAGGQNGKGEITASNTERTLIIDSRYLNFPVRTGAKSQRLKLLVDNKVEREFDIELVDTEPEWWAFMDASQFQGKLVTLQLDKPSEGFKGLSSIVPANNIVASENLYQENQRPQFHYSTRRGWMNDPNGLVYYKGEYHLFYQHNPYGWNWGNMHWGHAVSTDLVHWKELPVALYPDQHGVIFSGSAIVDWNNTAGFGQGTEKPMIAFFTAVGDTYTQGMAYSNDRGRHWNKYHANPILPSITKQNRDPKVIWYPPENKWIMVLYLDRSDPASHPELNWEEIAKLYKDKNTFGIFSSSDLKHWEQMSEVHLPGDGECAEFFEIAIDGDADNTRWIFYGAKGLYLVGSFDGKTFTPESGPHQLQSGNCFYASQTFNDIPDADGRRILIPWGLTAIGMPGFSEWFDAPVGEPVYKDMPFNQMMGLPVALTLRKTQLGLRLYSEPIEALETLRGKVKKRIVERAIRTGDNPLSGVSGDLFEVLTEISLGDAAEISFMLRGVEIRYDVKKQMLSCENRTGPLTAENGKIRLRILVDRTSVDIFGNRGALYMPMGMSISPSDLSLSLQVDGGSATIDTLFVFALKSVWSGS